MEEDKCGFCHTGAETQDVCGSLHKDTIDGKTVAAHHKCMQYSACLVQYKSDNFGGFKKHQVLDEIRRGSRLVCSLCKDLKKKGNKKGATSGCALKNCRKTFHYYCVSMNRNTVAKRYRVAAGQKVVILYRVFCSKKHEELYRQHLKAEDVVGGQQDSDSDSEGKESGDETESNDDKNSDDDDRADDDDDETDVEPAHKKQKGDTQMDTDEEPGEDGAASPPMTPEEVIEETQKEYHTLLNKRTKNSRKSQQHSKNGAGGSGVMTDVSASSHSESDASGSGNTRLPKGMIIIIPSKLEVGDLNSICSHTGYPAESSLLWPPRSDRKRLQDKHLPFVMWDIARKLRKQDRDGVSAIFTDLSASQYECLQTFHVQTSEADDRIRKKLYTMISDVNCLFKKEVCRLVGVTLDDTELYVMILALPKSYIDSIEATVYFHLHKWAKDTALHFDIKPSRGSYDQEKRVLLKLLKHRLAGKNTEMLVYPQDAILGNIGDFCVARDIEFKVQTLPRGTGRRVKVLVIRHVDRTVVQYKPYIQKLLLLFMYEREDCESFCVLTVKPGDGIRSLSDLLPENLTDSGVQVFSAFDPQTKPVSCLLLHVPGKHSSDLQSGTYEEEAGFKVMDSQVSVYLDNAES